jgi:Ca-activated chloride channel homolog
MLRDLACTLRVACALAIAGLLAPAAHAEDPEPPPTPCTEDAMIVFDASGSMSGNGWGHGSDTKGHVTRIDKVRASLGKVLPNVTRFRRVGLITYGPGPWSNATCISTSSRRRTRPPRSWAW